MRYAMLFLLLFSGCEDKSDAFKDVNNPDYYTFTKDGNSSPGFGPDNVLATCIGWDTRFPKHEVYDHYRFAIVNVAGGLGDPQATTVSNCEATPGTYILEAIDKDSGTSFALHSVSLNGGMYNAGVLPNPAPSSIPDYPVGPISTPNPAAPYNGNIVVAIAWTYYTTYSTDCTAMYYPHICSVTKNIANYTAFINNFLAKNPNCLPQSNNPNNFLCQNCTQNSNIWCGAKQYSDFTCTPPTGADNSCNWTYP